MIAGHATPEGTLRYAARFSDLTFGNLGRTGLFVSAAGFGGYRVTTGVAAHALALAQALTRGINLIDTSANYADGGSERLVGEILAQLIGEGRIARDEIVVITKGGYLQGENYARSQERKKEGRPFEDVVEVADGLEHCIHPDFLADQITRSLERLGVETIDGYLLHNPEYYLGWAHKNGRSIDRAREAYYRRIEAAFHHLEGEVRAGRIRFYGISANTFPAASSDAEFTELQRITQITAAMAPDHHFAVIQFPFNLFESGAVLERNQPTGSTLLALAVEKKLGVLINRPLNAFWHGRLLRLAEIEVRTRMDVTEIIRAIKALAQSETRLWRRILPAMEELPEGLRFRIKQQGCVAETLKHHWKTFGSFERWRQARDGIFLPRIQGVIDFLTPYAGQHPDLADWLATHSARLDQALRGVASIYADQAVVREKRILESIGQADDAWGRSGNLSQKAIRVLRTTNGVSSVLVGMRRETYVADVINELVRPIETTDRLGSWERLQKGILDRFGA